MQTPGDLRRRGLGPLEGCAPRQQHYRTGQGFGQEQDPPPRRPASTWWTGLTSRPDHQAVNPIQIGGGKMPVMNPCLHSGEQRQDDRPWLRRLADIITLDGGLVPRRNPKPGIWCGKPEARRVGRLHGLRPINNWRPSTNDDSKPSSTRALRSLPGQNRRPTTCSAWNGS
jgi:hypothetical protein